MTLSRRLSPSLSLRRRLPAVLLAVLLSLALCALSTPSATVFVAAQAPPPCPTLECTGLPEPLCEVRQTGATPGLDGSTLTKFIDALPRPAVAQPVAPQGDAYGRPGPDSKRCDGDGGKPSDCPPQYHFILAQTSQQLHSELPYKTTVYGYSSGGGPVTYPGPTIEARSGSPIEVRWENRLPRCHLLPVDPTIADTDIQACEMLKTQSRGVTHLHGGRTEAKSDGHPEAVRITAAAASAMPFAHACRPTDSRSRSLQPQCGSLTDRLMRFAALCCCSATPVLFCAVRICP